VLPIIWLCGFFAGVSVCLAFRSRAGHDRPERTGSSDLSWPSKRGHNADVSSVGCRPSPPAMMRARKPGGAMVYVVEKGCGINPFHAEASPAPTDGKPPRN
jgi:hypothetical protein